MSPHKFRLIEIWSMGDNLALGDASGYGMDYKLPFG